MARKRNKNQITAQILELCCNDNGANKTKIVYQVGLNFRTIQPYMDMLIKNGLLERIPNDLPVYKTTSKGKWTIEKLKEINTLYEQ